MVVFYHDAHVTFMEDDREVEGHNQTCEEMDEFLVNVMMATARTTPSKPYMLGDPSSRVITLSGVVFPIATC